MLRKLFFIVFFFNSIIVSAQNISGVVNIYRKVLWADSATARLKLSDVSGLGGYSNYKAMIIQMKGGSMDETATSSFGNINAINEAGYYEIGTICGFLSDTVVMERKLNNYYNTAGLVQFIIIPKYTNVTVTDTLKAQIWDESTATGGVVAIEATGTITLNKPITASGAGFSGGTYNQFAVSCAFTTGVTGYYYAYNVSNNNNGAKKGEGIAAYITNKEYGRGKQTNGGGGGNNHNAGGGGGSNYGVGGQGGENTNGSCRSNTPGIGGVSMSGYGYSLSPSTKNRIFLGGGGGAGHDNNGFGMGGGNGGGIVYISANTITGGSATSSDNKIMANGDSTGRNIPGYGWYAGSWSDGSGGGGGGGTVILQTNSFGGNIVTIEAKGGPGGNSELAGNPNCSGPGGGGGGGVVWFNSSSQPAGTSVATNGGANGTIVFSASGCTGNANNATSGSAGTTLFNFSLAIPKDSSYTCQSILPIHNGVLLSGYKNEGKIFLTATVSNAANVEKCVLQKSYGGSFADVTNQNGNSNYLYHFIDNTDNATFVLYRIKLINKAGIITYSTIIRFNKNDGDKNLSLDIFSNPAKDKLTMQVYSKNTTPAVIIITDNAGRQIIKQPQQLTAGISNILLPLDKLPAGILFITVNCNGQKLVKPFVKF